MTAGSAPAPGSATTGSVAAAAALLDRAGAPETGGGSTGEPGSRSLEAATKTPGDSTLAASCSGLRLVEDPEGGDAANSPSSAICNVSDAGAAAATSLQDARVRLARPGEAEDVAPIEDARHGCEGDPPHSRGTRLAATAPRECDVLKAATCTPRGADGLASPSLPSLSLMGCSGSSSLRASGLGRLRRSDGARAGAPAAHPLRSSSRSSYDAARESPLLRTGPAVRACHSPSTLSS